MTSAPRKLILVVEDDVALNRLLCDQLKRLGYETTGVRSFAEAEAAMQAAEPALVLLDIRLPDANDIKMIGRFHETCPVIIITAYGSVDQAVAAVREGAADYLVKPVSAARLDVSIARALAGETMRRKLDFLEKKSDGANMVGSSAAFARVTEVVKMVAPVDTTVLILGESGVGKELVAQSIHQASTRQDHQLVVVDCATLHENLLESELFGHERGAFTGADRKKEGLIEVADGGTVFLDEIGEISQVIQAKLLRVLETSKFRRLGGTTDISVDVRFITATNRDLKQWVTEGKFRSDLYYRLSPFVIDVPPLRERKSDILSIAEHFLSSRSFMRNVPKRLHPSAIAALQAYHWPGNIRELRNVVERGLLMSGNSEDILPYHLALPMEAGVSQGTFVLSFEREPTLTELEDAYMAKILANHGNRRAEAAAAMGTSERNLYRKLKPGGNL